MIRTLLKPLSFIPAILLMLMIFRFSAQPADVSSQLSYKVSYKIVETADYIFDTNLDYWQMDEWANRIHGVTRKLAHMTEYFALAVAVSFPLYVYGVHGIWLMLLAGIICVGFAAGDEYHQSFVSGRSPSVRDVCIDSFGVFWGIILVRIVGWTGRKTIFRPRKKKVKVKAKKEKNYSKLSDPYKNYYEEDDLPPYPPVKNYPPYQGQIPYQNLPPYGRQSSFQGQPPYPRQAPYQAQSSRPFQNSYQGQPPFRDSGSYQEYPPYAEQTPYPEQTPYREPFSPERQPPHPDASYENSPSAPSEQEKEPFFMKSAYDGAPKPYDPKDPFQDWMDDYFPENENSASSK